MKKGITSRTFRLTLNIIFAAQMLTLLIFSGVLMWLNSSEQVLPVEDVGQIFHYIVPIITITTLAASYMVFKMMIGKINPSLDLKQKLPKYQVAVIVRSALLELPGLLAAVAALITGDMLFLLASLLVIFLFLMVRPTPFRIAEDLNLSAAERNLLNDPDAIVSEIEIYQK
jgi:hypothetical protein